MSILCLALPCSSGAADGARLRQSFNDGWRFQRQAAPGAATEAAFLNAEQPGYNDAAWSGISLPHTWDVTEENPFTVPQHFRGIGWYRKTFRAAAGWRGRRVAIEFKGVFQIADVWLNGRMLGRHVGGFTGFQFDLTDRLRWDGPNVLAVRVDDVLTPEVAPANETNVPGYGGIYRSVSLVVTDPVYLEANGPAILRMEQSGRAVTVYVRAPLRNSGPAAATAALHCTIRDRQGQTVAAGDSSAALGAGTARPIELTLQVPSPRLWSPDSPYLYTLVSAVSIAGNAVDRVESPFGVRFMSHDAEHGFLLNGVPINLHGVNRRQDYGFLGDAVPEAVAVKDIRLIKEMGANFMRTSHYPQDPAVLDACDQLGILVWEEIPNIKAYIYPPSGDRDQAETVYIERFPRALIANLKQQLGEMIDRDRNHPSIIIWGLSDDLSTYHYPEDFTELSNAAHALDPTRWTAGRAPHVTDVIDATSTRNLAQEHQDHPERMYIWNEWGAYASERGREGAAAVPRSGGGGPGSSALADTDAALMLEADWMRYAGMAWLGTAKWCMFDTGEVNKSQTTSLWTIPREGIVGLRWPFNDYLGLADMWRLPKEGFYFLQSQWTEKPMVHIAGHWTWPAATAKRTVRVYSNCDTVELLLNGRSLGARQSAPAERVLSDIAALMSQFRTGGRAGQRTAGGKLLHGPFVWDDVAYEPGSLVAVGRKGDATVRAEVRTAKAAARIELRADQTELVAGGEDVAFVEADLIDAAGVTVPDARPWIHFTVSGPARLVGGVADIDAISGVAAINVQASGEAGEITVTATAGGLAAGTRRIVSKGPKR